MKVSISWSGRRLKKHVFWLAILMLCLCSCEKRQVQTGPPSPLPEALRKIGRIDLVLRSGVRDFDLYLDLNGEAISDEAVHGLESYSKSELLGLVCLQNPKDISTIFSVASATEAIDLAITDFEMTESLKELEDRQSDHSTRRAVLDLARSKVDFKSFTHLLQRIPADNVNFSGVSFLPGPADFAINLDASLSFSHCGLEDGDWPTIERARSVAFDHVLVNDSLLRCLISIPSGIEVSMTSCFNNQSDSISVAPQKFRTPPGTSERRLFLKNQMGQRVLG